METIFALSSGAPPAAIAVMRISGPAAGQALEALAGRKPAPRRATALTLRDAAGGELDRALVLWLPGPGTATGEDTAELHLHGGRAVVGAVEAALAALPGLRRAEGGEFTRRAFANGKIDLAEAEGLADLLSAETELERRAALALAGGALSRQVEAWRTRVLALSAAIEATLDFGDEDDVEELPPDFGRAVGVLAGEIADWLERPRAEPLREGYRVVLAGPPNSGKSSLFNALINDDAAIVNAIAGTTRDINVRSVSLAGLPFSFVDTAGLRSSVGDTIEDEGVSRALGQVDRADAVLWLGPEGQGPAGCLEVAGKADLGVSKRAPIARVSALTGEGLDELRTILAAQARRSLPKPGDVALNERQHRLLAEAHGALDGVAGCNDPLIAAELLRAVRVAFDRLTGLASTDHMLDALFGRFCIGK